MMGDICRISGPFHYRRNFNGRSRQRFALIYCNFADVSRQNGAQTVGSRQNSRETFFTSLGTMLDPYVWTNWSSKRGSFSAFKNLKQ